MKRFFTVLAVMALVLAACDIPGDDGGGTSAVYIAGSKFDITTSKNRACYWVGDNTTELPDAGKGSEATGITRAGGKVYVSGWYMNASNTEIACYWVDDVKHDLVTGNVKSRATAIVESGGVVYIAGQYESGGKSKACYWKNGAVVDMGALNDDMYATAILVREGDVYLAGYYDNGSRGIACFWKNGIKTDLAENDPKYGARATGIVWVTEPWVSGYYYTKSTKHDTERRACWWTSPSTRGDLDIPGNAVYSWTTGSYYSDQGRMFTSGGYSTSSSAFSDSSKVACFWNYGKRTDIPDDQGSSAVAISVAGSTAYVAGTFGYDFGCYWVDTRRNENTFLRFMKPAAIYLAR